MSKINCGINDLKKGERRGTMKECADKGQIRYYGLKKIDKRTLEKSTSDKKSKLSRGALLKKLTILRVKMKTLKNKIKFEKNKDIKEKLTVKIKKIYKDYKDTKENYDKNENKKYKINKKK